MLEKSLEGRVIVVTGGAGLIGQQFVSAVADAGGIAIVAELDSAHGQAICAQLTSEVPERRIEFAGVDITSAESVDSLISGVLSRHGRVDGLVNNAYPRNRQYGRRLEDVTYEDFCQNLSMHVGGYFLTSQRFLAPLRASGGGAIVNMASIYGVIAPRFEIYDGTSMTMPVEYAAIKAAIIHLTRYFAQYAKGSGVRVNCLSPGGVQDQQPESFLQAYRSYASDKGMLSPGDLQGALLFLLGDGARFVNGQNLIVDDGWSL